MGAVVLRAPSEASEEFGDVLKPVGVAAARGDAVAPSRACFDFHAAGGALAGSRAGRGPRNRREAGLVHIDIARTPHSFATLEAEGFAAAPR